MYNSKITHDLSNEVSISIIIRHQYIKQLSHVKIKDTEEMLTKDYDKMKKRISELEMENEKLKKL